MPETADASRRTAVDALRDGFEYLMETLERIIRHTREGLPMEEWHVETEPLQESVPLMRAMEEVLRHAREGYPLPPKSPRWGREV